MSGKITKKNSDPKFLQRERAATAARRCRAAQHEPDEVDAPALVERILAIARNSRGAPDEGPARADRVADRRLRQASRSLPLQTASMIRNWITGGIERRRRATRRTGSATCWRTDENRFVARSQRDRTRPPAWRRLFRSEARPARTYPDAFDARLIVSAPPVHCGCCTSS